MAGKRSGGAGDLRIQLRVKGQAEAAAMLRQLGANAADLSAAYDAIGRDMCSMEERWLRSSGDGSWRYLRRTTKERKQRGGWPPNVPVRRTGELRDSLTHYRHPMQIFDPQAQRLRFGTRVPYAVYQQGRRPLLAVPTQADLARWSQLLARHVFATSHRAAA